MSEHVKEEFDYLRSLRDSCPTCLINYIVENFYGHKDKEYICKWTYCDEVLVLCVLIKIPFLSKLIIYYQNSQWQYLRYDFEGNEWSPIMCHFLDLQDCVDIFRSKKERARFLRKIWDCQLNWLIEDDHLH